MRRSRAHGFTLLELVGVIVIASVGMVGVAKMFGNMNLGLARAADEQTASQFAQACAERILQTRRDYGLTSTRIATTMCDTPTLTGYVRSVTLPANYTGTVSTPVCPVGIVCRDATVTVCAGTGTCASGATSASVTLTMVSY